MTVSLPSPGPERTTEPGTVAGEVTIERAKSVVVVALRVDEDAAAQILLATADQVGVPVRVAAQQIMATLQAPTHEPEITHDTLERALHAVRGPGDGTGRAA